MSFNIITMIQLSRQVIIITIGPTHKNTDLIMKVTAKREVTMKTMVMKTMMMKTMVMKKMKILLRMRRRMLRMRRRMLRKKTTLKRKKSTGT